MNNGFEIKNAEVEAKLKELGLYLKGQMPANMGFTLLMSDFGDGGATFYISSVERDGALKAMKEFLVKQGVVGEDGAIPSPLRDLFPEPPKPPETSLPPVVDEVRAAGAVLVALASKANAPMIRVELHGFIGEGIQAGHWEIVARKL